MLLIHDTPVTVQPGDYIYNVVMTTGAVSFEISMDGEAFKPVNNGSFAADSQDVIQLPDCQIKALITGDGTAQIKLQDRSA